MIKKFCLSLLCLLLLTGTAHSESSEDIQKLQIAAKEGNAEAQNNLGRFYYKGSWVKKDYAEALKYFRLAAKQGNAEAQFSLGEMYDAGQGVAKSYTEALKWYRLAAERGVRWLKIGLDGGIL